MMVNEKELELLRSYSDGPRIWDAASLVPTVFALQEKGCIEPEPGHGPAAFRLTGKGRQVLIDRMHAWPFPSEAAAQQ